MGSPGKEPMNSNSTQRVKVYHIREDGNYIDQGTGDVSIDRLEVYHTREGGNHIDQGTGDVSIDRLESSRELGLLVVNDASETLLLHCISSSDIYRREEDTVISWKDPHLQDIALNFKESAGCSYIWDQIMQIQLDLKSCTAGGKEKFSDVLTKLPPLKLSTISVILKTVLKCDVANRKLISEQIIQDKCFFPRLFDLFQMNEESENMDNLYMISKLVKAIILLNSRQILDIIFKDEFIMDIIGTLEYDVDVSKVQPHRAFLEKYVIFKEVVPIRSGLVLSKIHQTYKINYIKDVILPRVLVEETIAHLNSIIHDNNVTVVNELKSDPFFIQNLLANLNSSKTSYESKFFLVFFLKELCSLGVSLPPVQQSSLHLDLASGGVFAIIIEVLQSFDNKLISAGACILRLLLDKDPTMLLIQENTEADIIILLGILVDGVIEEHVEDTMLQSQFLEIIGIILKSENEPILLIFLECHFNTFIECISSACTSETIFKSPSSSVKSGCLTVKPEILLQVCEIVCFCVRRHPFRYNFLIDDAIEEVLYLTHRREKYLVVSAIRFMRNVMESFSDSITYQHIASNHLFKPIIDAFVANGNRCNMLRSGVLNLLEYIRVNNISILITYIVECFWDQFVGFADIDTIQLLLDKYNKVSVADSKDTNAATEEGEDSNENDLAKPEEEEEGSSDKPEQDPQPSPSDLSISAGGPLVTCDDDDEVYNPPAAATTKIETCIKEESLVRPIKKIINTICIKDSNDDDDDEALQLKKKPKLEIERTLNFADSSHSQIIDLRNTNISGEQGIEELSCSVADCRQSSDHKD